MSRLLGTRLQDQLVIQECISLSFGAKIWYSRCCLCFLSLLLANFTTERLSCDVREHCWIWWNRTHFLFDLILKLFHFSRAVYSCEPGRKRPTVGFGRGCKDFHLYLGRKNFFYFGIRTSTTAFASMGALSNKNAIRNVSYTPWPSVLYLIRDC